MNEATSNESTTNSEDRAEKVVNDLLYHTVEDCLKTFRKMNRELAKTPKDTRQIFAVAVTKMGEGILEAHNHCAEQLTKKEFSKKVNEGTLTAKEQKTLAKTAQMFSHMIRILFVLLKTTGDTIGEMQPDFPDLLDNVFEAELKANMEGMHHGSSSPELPKEVLEILLAALRERAMEEKEAAGEDGQHSH